MQRLPAMLLLISCALFGGAPMAHALDPALYPTKVREFGIWLIRTSDPSSLHPASPLGVMNYEIPEGFPINLTYGFSASYGFSQFEPEPGVLDTLTQLAPTGSSVPSLFRLNRVWIGAGISRRTTIGAHFLDYPSFAAFGGGLSLDHVITDYKPYFICGRLTGTYAAGERWWRQKGLLAELQLGLHYTGFDLYVGGGTRLAQLDLEIAGDSVNRTHELNPLQGESWETHAGTEIFLTNRLAVGAGLHWYREGGGFGVRLIYKSRGTSPIMGPYLEPRQE